MPTNCYYLLINLPAFLSCKDEAILKEGNDIIGKRSEWQLTYNLLKLVYECAQ